MKFLKYISLFVVVLGGASCWGMAPQKLSFSDMKIEHESHLISNEIMRGTLYLCWNDTQIGFIDYTTYQVEKPLRFVTQHICKHFDEYRSEEACLAPFLGCKSAVHIHKIQLAGDYQQQGLGKQLMSYFLNHIKETQIEPVIWFQPAQSFYKKYTSMPLKEWHNLSHELNQRLLRFYQQFGATPYKGIYGYLYIDLKTEKTPVAPLESETELPE